MTMADKIVVMNAGRVEQCGAPLELYDRPANPFVAGFIGSPAMNFIKGRLTADGFEADGVVLPLPPSHATGEAIYGIRPEHFELVNHGLTATVLLVEPMGSETQVTMMIGDHHFIGVFRERVQAQPGATIQVQPDLASIHLFDARTSQRLN